MKQCETTDLTIEAGLNI